MESHSSYMMRVNSAPKKDLIETLHREHAVGSMPEPKASTRLPHCGLGICLFSYLPLCSDSAYPEGLTKWASHSHDFVFHDPSIELNQTAGHSALSQPVHGSSVNTLWIPQYNTSMVH